MNNLFNISATAILTLVLTSVAAFQAVATAPSWVATWSASPQPVWGADFLFPTNAPTVLHKQTVRQVARVSLGGPRMRIVLSNAYGRQPIALGKATVALPTTNGAVVADSLRIVTFSGRETATLLPGASLVSDPVALPIPALGQVAVSLYLPEATPVNTFHWDGRQTGWIVPDDRATARELNRGHGSAQSITARLLLSGIQVETPPPARVVAVIGDSITDGATASLDKNTRWPDFLAVRLASHSVAVVNAGISGGRLLSDGMGVNALARLERDVLAQPGVQSVIVMLGINDISWPGTAFAPTSPRPTLEALTAGYRQLIAQAHSRGIRVIGATLTPFEGALPDTPLDNYYHPDKDALRRQVNDWIRRSGAFDAVIDFDAILRDPAHPTRLGTRFDSGDRLHPGDEGNRAMAEAVDLNALLPNLDVAADVAPER
ncbi:MULTISPECIES: SGNH/GDSL hydrolase family protein [unclassified Brenneria]|uniref:SGNH/GDSL hydrolase family protein n=1 Tax=unclassified Brenneria TaxID=2634434 RepID=UPI0018F09D9D|nr:SGNH/GDSL hydrolase family protein [Brenneria sp. L3-3C-1]MBJ7223969.1 SGNH/GDSL hydrolase family protein [Brenneria sp. L3-3C-1]MEE3645214.1 SGNH/GDSL hydrolase family protein [Brenneria sp. L3_3C_1]